MINQYFIICEMNFRDLNKKNISKREYLLKFDALQKDRELKLIDSDYFISNISFTLSYSLYNEFKRKSYVEHFNYIQLCCHANDISIESICRLIKNKFNFKSIKYNQLYTKSIEF